MALKNIDVNGFAFHQCVEQSKNHEFNGISIGLFHFGAAPATTAIAINDILPELSNQLCEVTLSSGVKQNLALIGLRVFEITHETKVLFLLGLRSFPS